MFHDEETTWEYMEIVEFIAANEDEMQQGYSVVNKLGKEKREFNKVYPNIISVLNTYGIEGWELISVREIESKQGYGEASKYFSAITTYTLKRKT